MLSVFSADQYLNQMPKYDINANNLNSNTFMKFSVIVIP
jgi:hypothetical protein